MKYFKKRTLLAIAFAIQDQNKNLAYPCKIRILFTNIKLQTQAYTVKNELKTEWLKIKDQISLYIAEEEEEEEENSDDEESSNTEEEIYLNARMGI